MCFDKMYGVSRKRVDVAFFLNLGAMDNILKKYRKLMDRQPPAGEYIDINWSTPHVIKKIAARINRKFRQAIKNYQMVKRLR